MSRRFARLGWVLACWLVCASAQALPPYVTVPGHYLAAGPCDPHGPSVSAVADGMAATWVDSGNQVVEWFDHHGGAYRSVTLFLGGQALESVIATAPDGSGALAWLTLNPVELRVVAFGTDETSPFGSVATLGSPPVEGSLPELYATRLADGTYVIANSRETVAYTFDGQSATGALPLGEAPPDALAAVGNNLWYAYRVQLNTSPPSTRLAVARRGPGGPPEVVFETTEPFSIHGVDLAVDGRDRVTVAWSANGEVHAQRLSAQGLPIGEQVLVAPDASGGRDVGITADTEGNRLVTWVQERDGLDSGIRWLFGRPLLADDTLPSAPTVLIDAEDYSLLPDGLEHDLAVSGPGVATVAASVTVQSPILPPPCLTVDGVVGLPRNLGGERYLLLRDGRFRVEVDWRDPHNGGTGFGRPVIGTADAGSFWFFSPDNKEIEVKVLDGRPVNGHFWVFAAGLTDVGYQITVTDQRTGQSRTYENAPFDFGNFIDTSAFPAS